MLAHNDEFQLGLLTESVNGLRKDVAELKASIEDLKDWKAKVIGASAACSILVALMWHGLTLLLK